MLTLRPACMQERRELPKTIDGFKRSTAYVLERHITRYQGLEPGTARLGLHRGEAYYDRSRLSDLHSADRWRREGRQVLASQRGTPAKIVQQRGSGKAVGKGSAEADKVDGAKASAAEHAATQGNQVGFSPKAFTREAVHTVGGLLTCCLLHDTALPVDAQWV